MCWKEEWAYAIGNLNSGIKHLQKAQEKMQKRRIKAEAWLKNIVGSKHECVNTVAEIQGVIGKYQAAERDCAALIDAFRSQQAILLEMIQQYGFTRKAGGSVRVRRILEKKEVIA